MSWILAARDRNEQRGARTLVVALLLFMPWTGACTAQESESSSELDPPDLDQLLALDQQIKEALESAVQARCECQGNLTPDQCRALTTDLEIVPLTPECKRAGYQVNVEGSLISLQCKLEELRPVASCIAAPDCEALLSCADQLMESYLLSQCPELPDGVLEEQLSLCADAGR
jgi:hypothetical protein